MIVSSKTIQDLGNYGNSMRCNVNVHDYETGSGETTVTFNSTDASLLFHLSEKNLRDLARELDEAADVMANLEQERAA